MSALKAFLLAWLLASSPAVALTIKLSETVPFFQLQFVANPGVVIVCKGPSFTIMPFEFCDDGLGNADDPVASVQFFAPDLVNMRTNGMFCSDGGIGVFPSQCPPFFNGDAAVDFEDPGLPGQPSVTPYTPGMNDPGFGFFGGQAVDYELITNVPLLPQPSTSALSALGFLLLLLASRGRVRRRCVLRNRAD